MGSLDERGNWSKSFSNNKTTAVVITVIALLVKRN